MELRPYQREAVDATYGYLRAHDDNPCIVLPTAAGKTLVIATICRDAVGLWNGRVVITAHVKELLEQSLEKLRAVAPDLPVGLYSAGLKRRELDYPVTVAGVQSIYQRACDLGPVDLIIVDEAHMLPADGEGRYRQFIAEAKVVNPHVRIIGLTATPFRMNSGMICAPENILNAICYEIGVRELIVQGYLCPLRTKAGVARADMSGLHTRAGEFIAGEVEDVMDTDDLVQGACAEIVEQTADRRSVLIFTSGIRHGQHVAETLRMRHGVECGFVEGNTPAPVRTALLKRFKAGELKYLANVNVLTTGFDAPGIDCVAMLRPTLSPGLFYQMCLDMETEVLTSSGWRRCHEIATGDVVAAFDLDTEEITYVPALDKVHRALRPSESMYGVSAPHLDIRVTDQHSMVVRGRARTCLHWQIQTATEASHRKEMFNVPVAGHGRQHGIDAPLTDAEVEFIGWFLTDGYMNHANSTVAISQSTAKFVPQVRDVLTACGMAFREYRQSREGRLSRYADGVLFVVPRGHGRGATAGLRGWSDLAPWLDKDVPAIFNTLSRRQFRILLSAMNLANGRNHRPRDYEKRVMTIAVGCRQRMADRIQQLAIERGHRCNIAQHVPASSEWNRTPRPQWTIHVKPQRVACVGGTRDEHNRLGARRCRLGPVDFERNEWVWCLTTDKGTLVTRRGGKVAVVGNCGRGFRIHPEKADCLVLDFGGNIMRHGPVDDLLIDEPIERNGKAPMKECPGCHAIISAGYLTCPECGYEFPPPARNGHDAEATSEGILSDQVKHSVYKVTGVWYDVHHKRGDPDAPPTMRVYYQCGFATTFSEWICFEHAGFPRRKAEAWWRQRSNEPVPDTVDEAVDLARCGTLAPALSITIRRKPGSRYDEVVGHVLGPKPPRIDTDEGAAQYARTYGGIAEEELPF